MLAAAPAAAHAAAPNVDKAAEEENGLLGIFGGKPKYVFLFIGDGMGTAQIQSARFYKGTVDNNLLLPRLRFHCYLHRHRP